MAFKLPTGLPEISQFTKFLSQIEGQFEGMATQTGLPVPPGPQSQLLKVQKSVEAGKTPELPSPEALQMPKGLQLPGQLQLPILPQLAPPGGTTSTSKGSSKATSDKGSLEAREPYIAAGRSRNHDAAAIF